MARRSIKRWHSLIGQIREKQFEPCVIAEMNNVYNALALYHIFIRFCRFLPECRVVMKVNAPSPLPKILVGILATISAAVAAAATTTTFTMDNINFTLFNGNETLELKNSQHHYCGFYSPIVLSPVLNDTIAIYDEKEGKFREYEISQDTVIDYAFDGEDTIVTEKRLFYTEENFEKGTKIYTMDMATAKPLPIGLLLTKKNIDGRQCYAVQDGFKLFNIQLTDMKVEIVEKIKIIAYANRQFDTKQQLVDYILAKQQQPISTCTLEELKPAAVMYYQSSKNRQRRNNAQLIVYQKGLQIINMHLRKPLYF